MVFDEHVYPFSSLHPNARAQLRVELTLLPDALKNSSTFGDALLCDLHENSPDLTNVVSSSSLETSCAGGETDGAMENSVENPIDMNQNRSTNTPYHVCLPRGGSSCIEADPPGRAGESAGVSTLGSGSPVAVQSNDGVFPAPGSSTAPL